MSKHYFSAFFVFDTEKERDEFMGEFIQKYSIPRDGCMFSYSPEDESIYRDMVELND